MGCTSSREARDDYHPPRPLSRSYSSVPFYRLYTRRQSGPGHHRQHIVSLTSSTLGTLVMEPHPEDDDESRVSSAVDVCAVEPEGEEDEAEAMKKRLNDTKAANGVSSSPPLLLPCGGGVWTKVPRTPTMTPLHAQQPEIINAWELLAGLDDISPICGPNARVIERSRSFHAAAVQSPKTPPRPIPKSPLAPPPPAVEAGAPKSPQPTGNTRGKPPVQQHVGLVRSTVMAFQEKINAARRRVRSASAATINIYVGPPGGEGKVVVYLTSLRGVRRTFEDCGDVLNVLRGYGVRLDERDVSMDAGFKAELGDALLTATAAGTPASPTPAGWGLPRVFANGQYLGGADEVRQLHEAGKLRKILDGCQRLRKGEAEVKSGPCEACGDVRFVPCETCSGSCKVFVESEMNEEEVEEKGEREEEEDGDNKVPASGEFRRCTDCNENGLVRCHVCCSR